MVSRHILGENNLKKRRGTEESKLLVKGSRPLIKSSITGDKTAHKAWSQGKNRIKEAATKVASFRRGKLTGEKGSS